MFVIQFLDLEFRRISFKTPLSARTQQSAFFIICKIHVEVFGAIPYRRSKSRSCKLDSRSNLGKYWGIGG